MPYSENIVRLEELTPRLIDTGILFNLFKHANDLIAVANINGHFIFLNDKWEKLLGYTKEEMTSNPIVEFLHPDDIKSTEEIMARMNNDKVGVESFFNRYKTKDNGYIKLCWSSSPFINGLCYAIARKCPLA